MAARTTSTLFSARATQAPAKPAPTAKAVARPADPPAAATTPGFTAPRLLWKTFLRRCDSTPAGIGNAVYTGAGSFLYQLDEGGRTLWATETGSQQSSPALDDTRVYIGSDRGFLYAMNRKTGQVVWRAPTNDTILSAPAVGGGRVFFEGTDNNVYGVDAATGKLAWKFARPDGSLGYASPVYTPDAGLFVAGESNLYRLDPQTGTQTWRAVVGGKSLSTPAVAARRVFVGSDAAGLSAFSVADGKKLWTFPGRVAGDWFGAPIYAAGSVFVSTYRRYVYAVDAVTGRQKWATRLLGPALSAPVLDAGRNVLYVAGETFKNNPTLWAFDARTGKELWSFRAGSLANAPAIVGDRLYVGSLNGYLFAFTLK